MEIKAKNLAELEEEAKALVDRLSPKAVGATLVTLSGELGAGKTAFVQVIAKALGVAEDITSPTFVIQKIYALASGFSRLVHMDAYRLEGGAGLTSLGFDELLLDPHTLVMLEWPENVSDTLPSADVSITIEALPDGSRAITYA